MSAKQKAHIRAKLRKAVKKNPRVVTRKSFLRKASLVDFTLPVTIRLRNASSASNPNSATVDLGASLGQREINLGGTLPAQVKFHDSFDGGALGNVDLEIRPGGALTTTSLPLLWNTQVTDGNWWMAPGNPLEPIATNTLLFPAGTYKSGCGDFTNSAAIPTVSGTNIPGDGPNTLLIPPAVTTYAGYPSGIPGIPVYLASGSTTVVGVAAEDPGVDSIDNVVASKAVDTNVVNHVGGNPYPFPVTNSYADPGVDGVNDPTQPNAQDTVLRTGPITLSVATPGTEVDMDSTTPVDGEGPAGSQNIVIGKSGGQANLFGNIPGKSYGIDVTVSLGGTINSIIRQVDSDNQTLIYNQNWPAAAFQCRQAWTGGVQNYIPDVHLTGNLKIAPAIMADGSLRIAKATGLSTPAGQGSHVALAACLFPYSTFADTGAPGDSNGATVKVPAMFNNDTAANDYPINPTAERGAPDPSVKCNDNPLQLLQDANVSPLGTPGGAYNTSSDGSQVSIAGDVSVDNVDADVLIGDAG